MTSLPAVPVRAAVPGDVPALCECQVSSMSTPAGEILLLQVFGDVDRSTEHVLRTALDEARQRRVSRGVVDVAGMGFCSVRGLALLLDAAAEPAVHCPGYLLSGVQPHIRRYLGLLRPTSTPALYPSAGAAVLATMGQLRELPLAGPPSTSTEDGCA